jgi:hypothetical protein
MAVSDSLGFAKKQVEKGPLAKQGVNSPSRSTGIPALPGVNDLPP